MITAAAVRRQIENLSLELLRHQIAIQYNPPLELGAEDGALITWSSVVSMSETFGRFATVFEYRKFLSENSFSVLLADGAMLQFSYTIARNSIVAHRLCFYPCPIVFTEDERADCTIEELLDLCTSDWEERVRLRSPIRFDFSPVVAGPEHPSSHMTFSEDHCRIAVAAPLSLGHFVRFVFRHFYPEQWKRHGFLRELSVEQCSQTLDLIDNDAIFMMWRRP